MTVQLYSYPKCGTCQKAKKWLDAHHVSHEFVHIVEAPPSVEQLRAIYESSGLELKKFFNTSGMKYRELGIKDKVKDMTEDEQLALLASDGMLLKRPIVTDGSKVTLGFNEEQFAQTWL
ncbi:arsenate reductase family protein [Ectobacillus ponti]|uniref:Arsenate reductase family protein n=1 Tax=Ectobacillus ponti TaxID=2961894 RepID=A0AA41X9J3_9BACI|nr:arsenate reductase family protein [Ectobacillus ponti]MCP8969663.1 arsenate reductase family protein [Ectobacillus ponti]